MTCKREDLLSIRLEARMLQWRPTLIAVLAVLALLAVALVAGLGWNELENFNW
jgi:hypothetical protein